MVYAIQGVDGGSVKIGYVAGGMDAVKRRRSELQCGSPVELKITGTVQGGAETEALLHTWLDELRVRGEWFAAPDGPMRVCDCLLAKMVARATKELAP